MLKNVERIPHGVGFTLSKFGAYGRVRAAGGGRPESEIDTPVNIGNGPYRDNGEGVAAMPLPYPLRERDLVAAMSRCALRRRWGCGGHGGGRSDCGCGCRGGCRSLLCLWLAGSVLSL